MILPSKMKHSLSDITHTIPIINNINIIIYILLFVSPERIDSAADLQSLDSSFLI